LLQICPKVLWHWLHSFVIAFPTSLCTFGIFFQFPQYVKSLLLYLVGKKRCFACTGVVIESNESITRVLTSASLVRTSDNENMVADNLKVNTLLIIV
jgi:hypothetical protein